MTVIPENGQQLRESLQRERVFFEIFPDLRWQRPDSHLNWFEVALHARADEYLPPNHMRSRDAVSVLRELAEVLLRETEPQTSCETHLSDWYWTLHSPSDVHTQAVWLSRSLSLRFLDVVPYRKGEEPLILSKLRSHLSLLKVAMFEVDRLQEGG